MKLCEREKKKRIEIRYLSNRKSLKKNEQQTLNVQNVKENIEFKLSLSHKY